MSTPPPPDEPAAATTTTREVEEDQLSTVTTATTMKPSQSYSSYSTGPVIRSPKLLTLGSCSKDPCGIICMMITYSAVFYADYVVTRWIVMTTFVSLWGTFHVVLFNIIVGLLLMAHLRAVFTDPGFVTEKYYVDSDNYHRTVSMSTSQSGGVAESQSCNEGFDTTQGQLAAPPHYTLCPRCNIYRPPRAHHCRICKKCIRRMDHHCPWVNNCVGEFNQKYFIQFLFYVGLLSAYSIGLVLYTWVESSQQMDGPHDRSRLHYNYKGLVEHYGHSPGAPIDSGSNIENKQPFSNESHLIKQTRILHSVILMLESLLFGLFVLAILIDQFSAIFTDETVVEQHITRKHASNRAERRSSASSRRSKADLLRDVCGNGHFLLWILPCHTRDDIVHEKPLNEVV